MECIIKDNEFEDFFTPTESGYVLTKSIIKLDAFVPANDICNGSLIAALLIGNKSCCWCLFYEQGGDYNAFLDDAPIEEREDWMKEAITDGVKQMLEIFKDNENVTEDMEWFEEWATACP